MIDPHSESSDPGGAVRQWPADRPPAIGEALRASCAHCGLNWDVHMAMAGFRLRCECDAWVPVPHPLVAPGRIAAAPFDTESMPESFPWDSESKAADHQERNRLNRSVKERAPRQQRARLLSGSLFGTLGLTAAVVAPVALVLTEYNSLSWAILWPTMAALSVVLLGFAALFGRARYLTALRPAALSHHFEGLGVGLLGGAALGVMLRGMPQDDAALLWIHGLIGELGLPVAALTMVVLTALGHTLFFREVLGRRLQSLATPGVAAGVAALALAFSHGVGRQTIVLAVVALHAAWLRRRSRSAVPGLIEDLALASVAFGVLVLA